MKVGTTIAGAVAGLVVAAAIATAQTPTAADHKQWMDDAADIQDDLRDAISAKAGAKVADAAGKLAAILVKTERYWAAKQADDIVKLAHSSSTLATAIAAAGKAGKFAQASSAFTKLSAECNACHDLHPESDRRLDALQSTEIPAVVGGGGRRRRRRGVHGERARRAGRDRSARQPRRR
jgi:hypothetical protein